MTLPWRLLGAALSIPAPLGWLYPVPESAFCSRAQPFSSPDFAQNLKQPGSPTSISLLKGSWRQQPAQGVSSYSCHPRGKYKNRVSNPAVTKEVATREVPLAVGVTVIPASLATPLCHQLFGAGRTWPGSIQVGGSGEAAVTTRSSTTPNPPLQAEPLTPVLPGAASVLGRGCSPKAAI